MDKLHNCFYTIDKTKPSAHKTIQKEKKHKTGNDKIERSSIAIAQQREKHVVLRNYNVTLTLQPNMAQLESCVFCLMTCMVESLVDRRGELASLDVRSVTS